MRHATCIALAAVASLGLAMPACGQQARPEHLTDTAPKLEVDVIGDILYNSNVADSDALAAEKRGLTPQDVLFTPAINLDIVRPLGAANAFLNGAAGYVFHANNPILNRERVGLTGGVNSQLFHCEETLSGATTIQQSDLNEITLLVVKNTSYIDRVNVLASCGRSVGFSPSFSVSQTWATNSNSEEYSNDHRLFAVTGDLGYKTASLGTFGGIFEYNQLLYYNRQFTFGPDVFTQGYNTYTGGATYATRLGARLQGQAQIAYTDLVPTIPGGAGFKGLTYSFTGDYSLGARISVIGSFSRAAQPSTFADANFSVNERETATVAYALSERLKLRLTADVSTQTFHGLLLDPTVDLTQETIWGVNAAAILKLNRRLSLTLSLGNQERDANVARLSYSAFLAGLQARAAF